MNNYIIKPSSFLFISILIFSLILSRNTNGQEDGGRELATSTGELSRESVKGMEIKSKRTLQSKTYFNTEDQTTTMIIVAANII